jgi:hypothetical protein
VPRSHVHYPILLARACRPTLASRRSHRCTISNLLLGSALTLQVPGTFKGVSRYAIKKALAINEDVQVKVINAVLKKAVDQGKLVQTDQSFKLAKTQHASVSCHSAAPKTPVVEVEQSRQLLKLVTTPRGKVSYHPLIDGSLASPTTTPRQGPLQPALSHSQQPRHDRLCHDHRHH